MIKQYKTALVTGGAKRLGRSMVKALDSLDIRVAVHYNTSEKAAWELVAGLKAGTAIGGDLTLSGEGEQVFEKARDALGPIDLLINNASIFPRNTLLDFTGEDLMRNTMVHAYSPLALSRAFYSQNSPGLIINLIDTRIKDYDREHAAYHLSKRMLHSITKMTAMEFAPRVRVNAIAPGLVLPPEGEDWSYFEKIKHSNPLNSYGNEEDVVKALLFFLDSPFITGQTIYVDGGRHMKGTMYEA